MSSRLVVARRRDRLFELPARDQLALADQLLVGQVLLLALESLAEHVRRVVLGARERLGLGQARTVLAEVPADRVDRLLGHQPERRQLAAGDRHEPAHAVALGVVEQRVRAGDVARVGVRRLGVLEQRPHPGPHAQRPRLAEARARASRRRRASRRPRPAAPCGRRDRRCARRSCRSRTRSGSGR